MSRYSSESDSSDVIPGEEGREHHRRYYADDRVRVIDKKIPPTNTRRNSPFVKEHLERPRRNSGNSGNKQKKKNSCPLEECRRNSQKERRNSDEKRRCSLDSDKRKPEEKCDLKNHHHHHWKHHRRHYKKFFHSSLEEGKPCCGTVYAKGPLLVDDTTSISRILQPDMPNNMKRRNVETRVPEDDIVIDPNDDEVVATERKKRESHAGSQVTLNDLKDDTKFVVDGDLCPYCGKGTFRKRFTWTGVVAAIFCFPCGIICCFKLREKVCSLCGAPWPS